MADVAATPADQLRGRLRKYFLVVLGMLVGLFALLVLLRAGLGLAGVDARTAATVTGIASGVGMLSVVAGSWVAVARLWRCPACDQNIYGLVSWNMSVFAASAKSQCPGCGVELFTRAGRGRSLRMLVILMVIALFFGLAGAMSAGLRAQKNKGQTTHQTPVPPG